MRKTGNDNDEEEDDDDAIIQEEPITPAAIPIDARKKPVKRLAAATARLPPPKGVNDALRSFQASFGLAPSSPAAPSPKKAPPKSGLKSSFAGPSGFKNHEDPTTPLAKRSRLNHDLAEPDAAKTPLKLKPPTSFAKLLHTTEKQASSTTTPLSEKARGKKRMIPQDDDDEEESGIQEDADSAMEARNTRNGLSAIGERLGGAAGQRSSSPSKETSSTTNNTTSSTKKPLQALGLGWTLPILPKTEKHDTSAHGKEDVKPSAWNRMIPFMEEKSENQDILELLSPRKKRRGWVPNGLAERAAQLIKRQQTGHSLWLHEISRILSSHHDSHKRHSSSSSSSNNSAKSRLSQLELDTNPLLKLKILDIKSEKPPSLVMNGPGRDEYTGGGGGGYITAGAAEKLLVTYCRILPEIEEEEDDDKTKMQLDQVPEERNDDAQSTGLVVFSLAQHAKTSSATCSLSLHRPSNPTSKKEEDTTSDVKPERKGPKSFFALQPDGQSGGYSSLFIPASIADLHTQIKEGSTIWCWEPYSVVDLSGSNSEKTEDNKDMEEDQGHGKKALCVARFGVLV